MADTLGFNPVLLAVLVGGIALVGLGQLVEDIADFQDDADKAEDTFATGNLLGNLGVIAAGGALLVAGIQGGKANTWLRAMMIFLAVVLLFSGFTFGVNLGGSFGS